MNSDSLRLGVGVFVAEFRSNCEGERGCSGLFLRGPNPQRGIFTTANPRNHSMRLSDNCLQG